MPRTPDDTAATWRDLADQLTAEQIAQLEYCERNDIPPGYTDERGLNYARKLAELNLARAMYADIPAPADAIGGVDDWIDWGDGQYQRVYTAWSCHDGAVRVDVFGYQFSSGRIERAIVDSGDENPMTAEQARQRAAALLAAADELDRLDG